MTPIFIESIGKDFYSAYFGIQESSLIFHVNLANFPTSLVDFLNALLSHLHTFVIVVPFKASVFLLDTALALNRIFGRNTLANNDTTYRDD